MTDDSRRRLKTMASQGGRRESFSIYRCSFIIYHRSFACRSEAEIPSLRGHAVALAKAGHWLRAESGEQRASAVARRLPATLRGTSWRDKPSRGGQVELRAKSLSRKHPSMIFRTCPGGASFRYPTGLVDIPRKNG